MSDQTIRVGVIGAGANTRDRHIPGLLAQPNVEIVAVANRSRESGQRVAEAFGIATVASHWHEIVENPDLDAVVIGTWPYLHCATTVRTLQAGKHVMCEARMAMNAAEAREMYRTAQHHPHLVAQIVPSPMTLGVDKTIQRLVTSGWLGEPLAVDMQVGGVWLDRESPLHWRHDMARSGFNIMTMGIWYEALLRWVGEATSVMAQGKVHVRQRLNEETGYLQAIRIPDHIEILGDLACGASLHMQISSVMGLSGAPKASIYGSEGTLQYCDGVLYGGQRTADALEVIPIPEAERGSWRVEEEFVNAIRGQEPITHTDFATGVKYMEFTEAVTRSMQSGCAVAIPQQ